MDSFLTNKNNINVNSKINIYKYKVLPKKSNITDENNVPNSAEMP